MRSISTCGSRTLEWRQPGAGRRAWELVAEDEVFATLVFDGAFSTQATLRTADGVWQMRRKGVFNMDVLIFEPNSREPAGLYHPHWTGKDGQLLLHGTHAYTWTAVNFWSTRFEVRDHTTNSVLARYRNGLDRGRFRDIFKMQATMEIISPLVTGADLALLYGWGFYQIVLMHEQSAAVAATTTAATS